jgi:hypothetical protein
MTDPWHVASLTDQLLAPLPLVDRDQLIRVAGRLPLDLSALAGQAEGGGSRRLTDHVIRSAYAPVGSVPLPTPFLWSARTARRTLGLAAIRSLVSGEARTPADGVRAALADAMRAVRDPARTASTFVRWLTGLTAAGRAAVHAEAVTWATRLWCALDWTRFTSPPTIGRDHWWESPHSSLLSLRSRAEVRSVGVDVTGNPATVHLVLLSGTRRPSVRAELSVVALVEAMRAGPSLPPGRIVGWWPDSGHSVSIEVDLATLEAGVDAVRQALGPIVTTQAPIGTAA